MAESSDDGQTWQWLAEIPTRPGDSATRGYHELHGVEVDMQKDRDLAHGGQARTGRKRAAADRRQDLLSQLNIDRNAVVLEYQTAEHNYMNV